MSESINCISANSVTTSVLEQSDSNVKMSTSPLKLPERPFPPDDMVAIIKQKDLQIASLQATIEKQSAQIMHQSSAIEGLQNQMADLSSQLSLLVKSPEESVSDPKLASFLMDKSDKSKRTSKPKQCQTKKSSKSSTSQLHDSSKWPSLNQPSLKRRRHLSADYSNTTLTPSDCTNDDPVSIVPFVPQPTVNSVDTPDINNIQNPAGLVDDQDNNFVNFKKNSFAKDKDISPIEISIGNNEKGALHELLIKNFNNNSFLWSNAGRKTVRINPFTQKTKDNMIQWLDSRKYSFHTFLSKAQKPNAFIIRGLPNNVTKSQISCALEQAGIQTTALERHSTGYTRSHQLQSDLWRVTTPNGVTIQHFKAIDGILNVKIRVEVLKRSAVLQCKNCQLFFHSAAGCHRKFRCVKCDTDHPPKSCPRDSNKNLPVVCCNCHKNHSANDLKHCDFYAKHIKPVLDKRIAERYNSATSRTNTAVNRESVCSNQPPSAAVHPKVAFASVVANSFPSVPRVANNQQAHPSTTIISANDLRALLNQNAQLMTMQQELLNKLSCLIA